MGSEAAETGGSLFRIEKDQLGEVVLPRAAYYGAHTRRAQLNSAVSGLQVHPELIRALALVKQAAALANVEAGLLDKRRGAVIATAAGELAAGRWHDQIVVDPFQGGAGTSTHMNVNEVLANRAIEILEGEKGDYAIVHPLEHVNLGQSTNDVYPTAVRVAAITVVRGLAGALAELQGALQAKENEFASVLKTGRTQLQDAVPVTLGQEFGAWAEAVARDWWRLYKAEERLRHVNLGGTVVGTGLNANRRYVHRVVELLRELTGLGLTRAENTFEATQNADVFAEVSGFVRAAAVNLAKIAGDLRLLASGPRAGLGEIKLPAVQVGSSLMPGKVNPVIPEMVTQVSYQVLANDAAVGTAAASGQLELNPFLPLIAHNLLQSLTLLTNAANLLDTKCIRGLQADAGRCRELLDASQSVLTAFVPYIGYDQAAELAVRAAAARRPVTELLIEEGFFTKEELDSIIRPEKLTTPGVVVVEPEPAAVSGHGSGGGNGGVEP